MTLAGMVLLCGVGILAWLVYGASTTAAAMALVACPLLLLIGAIVVGKIESWTMARAVEVILEHLEAEHLEPRQKYWAAWRRWLRRLGGAACLLSSATIAWLLATGKGAASSGALDSKASMAAVTAGIGLELLFPGAMQMLVVGVSVLLTIGSALMAAYLVAPAVGSIGAVPLAMICVGELAVCEHLERKRQVAAAARAAKTEEVAGEELQAAEAPRADTRTESKGNPFIEFTKWLVKWLALIPLTLGGLVWAYTSFEDGVENQVEASVSAGSDQCTNPTYPLYVRVVNKSSRTVKSVSFHVAATIPGHSTDVADRLQEFSSDAIIEPGGTSGVCWNVQLDNQHQTWDRQALEYAVAYKHVGLKD